MILTAQAGTLGELIEARDDPMSACRARWLKHLRDIPDDAMAPLAMSGPHPRAVGSYGAECIAWAQSEMGLTLRWWQALAVTRQLEYDKAGALVWREIVESGPRRIGKSVRLRVTALWRLANATRFLEPQLAMLVSKDLAVGKEIHRPAWAWAEKRSPQWNVLRLNGGQEVETPAGDRWLLRAPNAAYGYDVGYGQVDESWDVDPMAITDGLEPALLERHSPQLHLTSTAHVRASSLMRRRLTAALRDADPDVLLLLWGARPGADISEPETWRASSPHWSPARQDLVRRKYAAALAGQDEPEFDDPDPIRGWAAQYLNVWPLLLGSAAGIFPRWDDLTTEAPPPDPAALGVAADRDGVWLSLGASSAGTVPHLGSRLRVRADQERVRFVAEVARIQREYDIPVAIDPKGPAMYLIEELKAAGVWLKLAGLDDRVQGDTDLEMAVSAGQVTHGNYPDLNAAVDAADWRYVNDRRLIGRKNGDVSMLEAVSLARWGAQTYDVMDSAW